MDRYFARKTNINGIVAVIDRTTGKSVDRRGTFPAAQRRAAALNAAVAS